MFISGFYQVVPCTMEGASLSQNFNQFYGDCAGESVYLERLRQFLLGVLD